MFIERYKHTVACRARHFLEIVIQQKMVDVLVDYINNNVLCIYT